MADNSSRLHPSASAKQNAINLYLDGILRGKAREAVHAYTGSRYTQHSTGVPDGPEGFVEFFQDFFRRNPSRKIEVLRALQDGRHVFVHALQEVGDGVGPPSKWVTMDFFDTQPDARIVEHWDVISALKPNNASGRSMVDGPTEIADLDRTKENKGLVQGFVETVLIKRDVEKAREFINSEKYMQHNAEVADGLEAFLELFSKPDCPLSYQDIFHIVAEGNFVATLSRARWGDQDLCQTDLFRVENGLIVEHWDNSEPIPTPEVAKNSGKF